MEERIVVIGDGIREEIIGQGLFDCVDTAYRKYRGQQVELFWIRPIGCIDRDDLFIHEQYLDRYAVREIVKSRKAP